MRRGFQDLLEAGVTAAVGAWLHQRCPDERATHRNGYCERLLTTRVGDLTLATSNSGRAASLPTAWSHAAPTVSRACLRERVSKGRPRPLILHADNGNAMRAATLESRLEELGVLRSFSRPRVSNDNPYSQSLFRTVKHRPD